MLTRGESEQARSVPLMNMSSEGASFIPANGEQAPNRNRLPRATPCAHRFLEQVPADKRSLFCEVLENECLEQIRQVVMARRDNAIQGCILEIGVSILAMGLYDLRRSILIPALNGILILLSAIGLRGALGLQLKAVQVHGVITTGLLIAGLLNFLAEAFLTSTGMACGNLPSSIVLIVLMVPYSVNLFCSVLSLLLGTALQDFYEREEQDCGLTDPARLEAQAQDLRGQDLCCMCLDKQKNAVLTPCGHKAMCLGCAEQLYARGRNCPLCRARIGGVVRVWE